MQGVFQQKAVYFTGFFTMGIFKLFIPSEEETAYLHSALTQKQPGLVNKISSGCGIAPLLLAFCGALHQVGSLN